MASTSPARAVARPWRVVCLWFHDWHRHSLVLSIATRSALFNRKLLKIPPTKQWFRMSRVVP